MNKNQTKGNKANNSTPVTEERVMNPLAKILQNIQDTGASVVYIFKEERESVKGELYTKESKQVTPLNPGVLRDEKGNKRSVAQIEEILQRTASDLGASHFYIQ